MLEIKLSESSKKLLEKRHKKEKDKKVADRMKVVLLRSENWSQKSISQALRITEETVHQHIIEYQKNNNFKPKNGGSTEQLSKYQSQELSGHLSVTTYRTTEEICIYVYKKYGVVYSKSGMRDWLKRNGFSYKKPKGTPLKADKQKQEEFIYKYLGMLETMGSDEVLEFGDGVHPTMATKISYGWIKKGKDKLIETTASRTRMNLFGSINLSSMSVTIDSYDTIDSKALEEHCKKLRFKYPTSIKKIHLILDQGAYNKSKATQEAAKKYGIVLHYLPPYSPNLNPIERLWKLMNEHARNNRFFASTKDFKNSIMNFFWSTWEEIKNRARARINDNFQTL